MNMISFAQAKMVMSMDGKESDILGYSLEPSTGSAKEISLFGPMQNASITFQFDVASSKIIPALNITTTDANTGTTTIKLLNVTVLDFKQYNSTYANGIFEITSGGSLNSEVKCKYEKIEIITGASKNNGNPRNVKSIANTNDDVPGYESVIAKFDIVGNEHVDVKINGNKILAFGDGSREVNLSHFLLPGKSNTVTFSFTKGAYSRIEVIGKFPDDAKGTSIYSFHPNAKELEGTFEFQYTGVKKK